MIPVIGVTLPLIISVIAIVAGLGIFFIILSFISVYLKAWSSGAPVSMMNLIFMRFFRKLPYGLIVEARITAVKAGIDLSIENLETHFMAGGDIMQTTLALINAQKAGLSLDWNQATVIDLATKGTEKSVLAAVRTSINPIVIDCPERSTGKTTIDGVAKDGIQVKARARVTVRSNLERYVGSAQEETIIARVGEGIITTIGSAESYKYVLENPDSISKNVLNRGLDVGTAFEIISIDIADIDIGDNIGAHLQEAQAEANKKIAQAQAEIRRAAAVALEQEMKAKVEEMNAKLVEAQSKVPLAIADAFRAGNLGIMDYYRLENIQSDTSMRKSISDSDSSTPGSNLS
ncbi:MAG: flotillin-like protein FloA [Verrucomicrobia bacterium]|nr:flotillin-like protein FloA [Verrucomicrobiota bacterium]MDA1067466.1 flotillin-like protein FloA [Verrucomicrobiota bacterium]